MNNLANQAQTEIMRAGVNWQRELIGELERNVELLRSEKNQGGEAWAAEFGRRIETLNKLKELASSMLDNLELQFDTEAM